MKKINAGFTLIEIIVVLIIVGILAAIAVPKLFSNINKNKSQEAFASFESWKVIMEACLDANIGNESVCAQGGAKQVTLPVDTANFTFSMYSDATNTGYNGAGLSNDAVALQATLKNGAAADILLFFRQSDGTWGCAATGIYTGLTSYTAIP